MFKRTTNKIKTQSKQSKLTLAVVALLFAGIGGYFVVNSFAAPGDAKANVWVSQNGSDTGSNCKLFSSAVSNPDTGGTTLCKSFSAALSKASAGSSVGVLTGSFGSQSLNRTDLPRDTVFENNVLFFASDGPGTVTLAGLNVGSSSSGSYGGVAFDGFKVTGGPTIQEAKDVKFSRMEVNNQTYISNSQNVELNDYKVQPNGWPSVTSAPFANGWGVGIVQQGSGSVSAPSDITLDKVIIRGVRATQAADHPDGVFMWRGGGVSSATQWKRFKIKNSLFYNNECINWRYNDSNPVDIRFENNFFDASVNGISGCGYYSISVASETGSYLNNTIRGGVQVREGDCSANCGATRVWKNNIILGGFSDSACTDLAGDSWSHNIFDQDKCSSSNGNKTATASEIKFAGGSTYPDSLFLTSASLPAIDAGDSSDYPATDYLGNARPNGAGPDIGAHEFGATAAASQNQANIWVDPNGGNCTRQSTPGSWSDSLACARFQDAWSMCQPGDTIIVKSSATSYGAQSTSGTKSSPGCTIEAEAPDTVTVSSLSTNGGFLTIKDITVDVGLNGRGGWSSGDNVTAMNLKIHGGEPGANIQGAKNVTWDGGELGQSSGGAKARDFCNGSDQPVTIASSSDIKVKHVTFWPQTTGTNNACNHMENFRIDGTSTTPTDNILLEGNFFKPGDGSNTARVFITVSPNSYKPTNIKIINNYFGGQATAYDIDVHADVTSCSTFTIAYNILLGGDNAIQCSDFAGMKWIGNAGGKAGSACRGIFTKNVWVSSGNTACGSDKWVSGNAYSAASALGVGSNGRLTSTSSPAYNAGESDTATDYCTNPLYVGSVDFEGNVRPFGGSCDAGASEYGSSPGGGTTCTSTKTADINCDNIVSVIDLSLLLNNYSKTTSQLTNPRADIITTGTSAGKVDISDLSALLSQYGK